MFVIDTHTQKNVRVMALTQCVISINLSKVQMEWERKTRIKWFYEGRHSPNSNKINDLFAVTISLAHSIWIQLSGVERRCKEAFHAKISQIKNYTAFGERLLAPVLTNDANDSSFAKWQIEIMCVTHIIAVCRNKNALHEQNAWLTATVTSTLRLAFTHSRGKKASIFFVRVVKSSLCLSIAHNVIWFSGKADCGHE